ncbi:MAG: heme-binding domain-containing protein [Bacteroidetes bacterium]|nr:heme-binding domain-containing protein [Bacteroidota bacterium]
MKILKLLILILIISVVIIQFIPNDKPEVVLANENDLIYNNQLPENISVMLKESCYDCHSNETVYPWYSHVAPVSWLVVKDIRDGRKELNFSFWESQSKMDKAKHLDNIIDEVLDENMPMPIYTIMHANAKLTKEERQLLADWAERHAESLFE